MAQRRARHALNEPNSDSKNKHIATLKSKIIGNATLRNNLKQEFKNKHARIGKQMSETMLVTSACRLAASRVYAKALSQRKKNVGQMLRSIRQINAMTITPDNLGVQYYCAASEPYFYDTAYALTDCHFAIPVDEHGRCIIAEELGCWNEKTNRSKKWKCTEECKLPSEEDIASICKTKTLFQLPMNELRDGLNELDRGCPSVHHVHSLPVDCCIDDEIHEEELSQQLMGHPIPCTFGMCGSVLRRIRSAAVQYPCLRTFLSYLYHVRKHHKCISDIDAALSSANFQQFACGTCPIARIWLPVTANFWVFSSTYISSQ